MTASALFATAVGAQEEPLPDSPFELCKREVSARGGDAWAAGVIALTSEDCCPYESNEKDYYQWCDPEHPYNQRLMSNADN